MPHLHHFSPAQPGEPLLFGANRPGYPRCGAVDRTFVAEWTGFMRAQGIVRVVCLLDQPQLAYYDDLPGTYRAVFAPAKVLSAPVPDYDLPPVSLLREGVLPFVREALRAGEKTVIHCSAGRGRTGFMLVACLVAFRGLSNEEAIDAVAHAGRNARESGNPPQIKTLLDECRQWAGGSP